MTKTRRDAGAMFGATKTDTFLGLPSATPDTLATLAAKPCAALFGAGCATPYGSVGAYCAEAPRAIRNAMGAYSANLAHMDFDLGGPLFPAPEAIAVDLGDLGCSPEDPAANRTLIRETTAKVLAAGIVPILVGGDDSVPIPFLEAFAAHGPITIVQIDAHIDWRDEVQGERLGLSSTMRRASEMAHVERIVQVGQRGIGSARPSDWVDACKAGVAFVPAREVHAAGVAPALALVPEGARVVVAFDVDALDPAIMPGVIAPSPGGLSYWQVAELLHGISGKAAIAGFDIVEFLPERDTGDMGAMVAGRLIANVLGLIARAGLPAA